MIAGIAQFLDAQFIDPAVAAVAGVNPASITNGAPTAAATANPLADIMGLIDHFATNNIPVDGVTFIMSPANALSLSFRTQPATARRSFPASRSTAARARGCTFITSNAAGDERDRAAAGADPLRRRWRRDDRRLAGSLAADGQRARCRRPMRRPCTSRSGRPTRSACARSGSSTGSKANANAVKYLTATAWPAPTGAERWRPTSRTARSKAS